MIGPRLYCDRLNALFEEDSCIDEIGILWLEDEEEVPHEITSAFVLEQHKLGIANWCIPIIYKEARSLLTEAIKTSNQSLKLLASRALVVVSADCYTGWNVRKQGVIDQLLSIKGERQFTAAIFTKQPKSIDTWAYRRWLTLQFLKTSPPQKEKLPYFRKELDLCQDIVILTPRNYHAWSYKSWIAKQLPFSVIQEELLNSDNWTRQNISDHSGWYYRMILVKRLLKENVQILYDEFKYSSRLLQDYYTHETLWYYRRFLCTTYVNLIVQRGNTIFTEIQSQFLAEFTQYCQEIRQAIECKTSMPPQRSLHISYFQHCNTNSAFQLILAELYSMLHYSINGEILSMQYMLWVLLATIRLLKHANIALDAKIIDLNNYLCDQLDAKKQKPLWKHLKH